MCHITQGPGLQPRDNPITWSSLNSRGGQPWSGTKTRLRFLPSVELESRKAAVDYHTLLPFLQEIGPSSPTVDTGLCEKPTDETRGSDGEPSLAAEVHPIQPCNGGSSPPAETPPSSSSDEPKSATDRITDGKEIERLVEDKAEGSDCPETQPTVKQSTRKRKRPDQGNMFSKRQKTALFSPMEIELQCLVRMFGALSS
ncbi:uncharacterized protein LOC134260150 [Saccostrea cucullata]|uniref:uncharacterized protein LOC134260150 n=1 Tax=Saccostrea cuccullata TaxID=36930 RepID=UPI002ED15145